jgi:hypothetical protein
MIRIENMVHARNEKGKKEKKYIREVYFNEGFLKQLGLMHGNCNFTKRKRADNRQIDIVTRIK